MPTASGTNAGPRGSIRCPAVSTRTPPLRDDDHRHTCRKKREQSLPVHRFQVLGARQVTDALLAEFGFLGPDATNAALVQSLGYALIARRLPGSRARFARNGPAGGADWKRR